MKKIIKYALADALGTVLYVAAVASFIYFLGQNFGQDKSVFVPIAMLMLLVFSVAFVGVLFFGRPVMWYLDGKKKEALSLLVHTFGIFLIATLVVFAVVIWMTAG